MDEGARDALTCERHPHFLETLAVGRFNSTSLREILARRILLLLRVPTGVLAAVDAVARRRLWAPGWHAFAHRYFYWRGVRIATHDADRLRRLMQGVPILMYHAIGSAGECPSTYVLPAQVFAAQMRWLDRRGRRVLSLDEYRRLRETHRLPPAKSVVITFDDGYADNRHAQTILRDHGFPAEFFVVSGSVGDRNRWDRIGPLADRSMLTWADLKALQREGFGVGAHTTRHVSLTGVPPAEALAEVVGSREMLERRLERPVETFSYPNGRHDTVTQAIVEEAGLRCGCTSERGINDPGTPLFSLRRIEIRGHLELRSFAIALWTGKPGLLRALREGSLLPASAAPSTILRSDDSCPTES